ncbi:MAG: murein L,D-transpeptidase catalytic domain family protein [Zoogloeaceae bacterium]|jgi:hypothetical protein|nr:murein L,D-transpeptidase catalytic domain family protein [Zoogloeaceae bacterium]
MKRNLLLWLVLLSGCGHAMAQSVSIPVEVSVDRMEQLKLFSKEKGYNTRYAIFIDMSIHSGKNRMFAVDLHSNAVIYKSLVSHGMGGDSTPKTPVFSNVVGSKQSSLGKYRIGIKSYSRWGVHYHYKLHGLESTNSNAYRRNIVLHSYACNPDHEIYPEHLTCYSEGCPMVSNTDLTWLHENILRDNTNVVMWIYQ